MNKISIKLRIKVTANASKDEIVGWEEGELKIKIRAQPEKGRANQAIIAFLAERFSLPQRNITLHAGQTNRHKCFIIKGISKEIFDIHLSNQGQGAGIEIL